MVENVLNIGVVNFPTNWGDKEKNLENIEKYIDYR